MAWELAGILAREEPSDEVHRLMDVYLDVISEKAPPEEESDPEEDLADFHRRLTIQTSWEEDTGDFCRGLPAQLRRAELANGPVRPVAQTPPAADPAAQTPPEKPAPRKVRHISPRRLMTAAILIVLALTLGGYATGFRWPDFLVIWREEILLIQPADSGEMELPEVEPNYYRSLRAALENYALPSVDPKWIPIDFSVTEVMATEAEGRIDIVAIYTGAEEREIFVRIIATRDVPTIAYEKNNDGKKNIYTTNDVEFQLTGNMEHNRATWVMEDCYCSITGDITEEQLKLMIESIFKE